MKMDELFLQDSAEREREREREGGRWERERDKVILGRIRGEQWKMVAKEEGRVGCRGCARLHRSIFHFSFANQPESERDKKNYPTVLARLFGIQPLYVHIITTFL